MKPHFHGPPVSEDLTGENLKVDTVVLLLTIVERSASAPPRAAAYVQDVLQKGMTTWMSVAPTSVN